VHMSSAVVGVVSCAWWGQRMSVEALGLCTRRADWRRTHAWELGDLVCAAQPSACVVLSGLMITHIACAFRYFAEGPALWFGI